MSLVGADASPQEFLANLTDVKIPNISGNQEWFKIPVVNRFNDEIPKTFDYRARPVISIGVTKMSFLTESRVPDIKGCDCEGEKCDPRKCLCEKQSYLDFDVHQRRFDMKNLPKHQWRFVVECGKHCACKGRCGRKFLLGHTPKYQFIDYISVAKGFGVRSAQTIRRGSIVSEYCGSFIVAPEEERQYHNSYQYTLKDREDREYLIDGGNEGNIARFYSHSCNPNLVSVLVQTSIQTKKYVPTPRVVFLASRNIIRGDELCINYGEDFFQGKDCFCFEVDCFSPPPIHKFSKPSRREDPWYHNRKLTYVHRRVIASNAKDLDDVIIEVD